MTRIQTKLLYSATMSLEGFIAGVGGDMSWLADHLAPGPEIDELTASIGALLVGKRTFTGDDPNRDTQATRRKIRAAAAELFVRRGCEATSMKAIAAEAGVSDRTVSCVPDQGRPARGVHPRRRARRRRRRGAAARAR
jgi:riboflavin biosynthesis pyrimidine reductase